jgi:hypothetical protein
VGRDKMTSIVSPLEFYTHTYFSESFNHSSGHPFQIIFLSFTVNCSFFLLPHTFHEIKLLWTFYQVCREEKKTQKRPEIGKWSVRLLIMLLKHNHILLVTLTFRVDDGILIEDSRIDVLEWSFFLLIFSYCKCDVYLL